MPVRWTQEGSNIDLPEGLTLSEVSVQREE